MWSRCPLCPSRALKADLKPKYVVPGVGNEQASIAFVGEGPGREENSRHFPFAGKTGAEMDGTYLLLAGESRPNVYLTNACKCHWADSSDAPPNWLVKSCSEYHLRRELGEVNPKLVVLMGGVAAGLAGLDVDMEHGFLKRDVELLGWRGDLFVTYHPALGMHKSSGMLALLEDFKALRARRELPTDKYPNPTFKRLTTAREVRAELGDFYDQDIAVDTESIKRWAGFRSTIQYTPWCATFCREAGRAYMVRISDRGAWLEFGRQIQTFRRILMHNTDHDMEILRRSEVLLDWAHTQDTMQLAYHDGRLGKGLKSLGYRLLGSRMRSFDDVAVPYGVERAMEWLGEAVLHEWPVPKQEGTGVWEWRACRDCGGQGVMTKRRQLTLLLGEKPVNIKNPNEKVKCDSCVRGKVRLENQTRKQGVGEKLNRLVGDLGRSGSKVDIWERWEGWNPEDITSLAAKLGAIPLPSIDFVPEDEALEYACSDAHNTLRIAPVLRARVAEIRRRVR